MATMNNVLKWFKEKTKKSTKPGGADTVRQLPTQPSDGATDEYGFRTKDYHIYEEILIEEVDESASRLENLAISEQAEDVRPYLVVPIAGNGRRNSSDEDDDSVFADTNDSGISINATPSGAATYDQCNSLYNAIPSWVRANMKQCGRKRHGIAVNAPAVGSSSSGQGAIENRKPSRRKSTDAIIEDYRLRCGVRSHSTSSCSSAIASCGHVTCSDGVCREEMRIDDIYQQSNSVSRRSNKNQCNKTRCSDSDVTFGEYDLSEAEMKNILSEKEYEFYLIKAEKNFQLERELKKSIDESSSSEYGEYSEYGAVDDAEEYCEDCNNRRSKQRECCKGCNATLRRVQRPSRRGLKMILVPRDTCCKPASNDRHRQSVYGHKKTVSWCSLESLNSSNYSSTSSSSNQSGSDYNPVNMDAYYSRDVTSRLSAKSKRSQQNPVPNRRFAERDSPRFSPRPVSGHLSCRATNATPTAATPRVGIDSDDNMYGSIYDSCNTRQNRMLADVMKMNHDRQLMML